MLDSIPARFMETARRFGDRPAIWAMRDGRYQPTSWNQYAETVRRAASALIAWGVHAGDAVCILGFNRPEWAIVDIAAMCVGAAPAGIYTTCSSVEVAYILRHSEARVILVENHVQWKKIDAERHTLPRLERVVLMANNPPIDDPMVVSWEQFLAAGAAVAPAEVDQRVAALSADQVATLIYTSGTTGPPKAVMLTHNNLAFVAKVCVEVTGIGPADSVVSYLPLSHIAEQSFTLLAPATAGYPVYFAESLERLPDNLRAAQPTIVFGVPRIWEKFQAKVRAGIAAASGPRAWAAGRAMQVGARATALRNQGQVPTGTDALMYRLARALVFDRLLPKLGLARARLCITGAAPISRDVLDFFASLDITLYEVYGQSEDSGPTTLNLPGATRLGTVGRPLPGTEVRIAADGEILVRGDHVFAGYFKDPVATRETLVDGWLNSGDLGAFDDDGFLTITGRKKDILITAGGKNIAPKNIEVALAAHPLVSQAVVIGDRRRFLSALMTLAPDAAAARCAEVGWTGPAERCPAILEDLQAHVDAAVNPQFARVEHVRRFAVLPRELTIDAGELTPTLKIKRKVVEQRYQEAIEAMYVGGDE